MLDDVQIREPAAQRETGKRETGKCETAPHHDASDAGPSDTDVTAQQGPPPAQRLHWTHGLVNRLVRASDGMLLALAGLTAWAAGLDDSAGLPLIQAAIVTIITIDVYLRTMTAIGAYRVENYRRGRKALFDTVGGLLPAGLVHFLLVWAFLPPSDGQGWMALWAGVAVAYLAVGRAVAARMVRRLEGRGALRRKVVLFGATDSAERMIRHLAQPEHRANYDVLALFDDRGADRRPESLAGMPVAGDLIAFKSYLQNHSVDMIVIALPWRAALRIHSLCMQLQMISLDILIPLDEENFKLRLASVRHIGDTPALLVMRQPLRGMQVILKRVEDVVVAALGLLVASPVMLAAALAIRLESPGPVIFRQTRVGFNNRPFTMLKFRTMTVDEADDGALGTRRDNPRITRVGAILRRTSIDELPQLFNVLAGDMSVVGPRAHVPNMRVGDHRYAEAVREYAARCRVKPGITGWAQINGMRGGIHSIEKARAGVEMDIHYIENWSLWFDTKIMVSTLATGLFGRDVF